MTRRVIKHYPDIAARQRAEANYRWLTGLNGPAHLPALLGASGTDLCFEHIDGHHAHPEDLTMLATHLGDVHGAAYAAELHHARLDSAHHTAGRHVIPGFADARMPAVARELSTGNVPGAALTLPEVQRLLTDADGPAAFYKDANPRNFVITPAGTPVTIDFDDLTLAPFGYDLAKLIVTLVMAHGPLIAPSIAEALHAYNAAAAKHCATLPSVSQTELMNWAEIHHILTSRYAADDHYPYHWNEQRPALGVTQGAPVEEAGSAHPVAALLSAAHHLGSHSPLSG
jgi:Ser/Thr protein kinase RdoA (MazF antagonist)